MAGDPKLSNSRSNPGAWRGILAGGALLATVWLCSVLAEPYLIAIASPSIDPSLGRRSASGWANSSVWLLATSLCTVAAFAAGFLAKWLSSSRSWVAPVALVVATLVYVFFAQFPATRSTLRIAFWSLSLPVSVGLGAWVYARGHRET